MGKKTKQNSLCFTDRLFHESDLATVHVHIREINMKSVVYASHLLEITYKNSYFGYLKTVTFVTKVHFDKSIKL
ncbi:hypothetical protein GCM10007906_14320 [Vibrio hyugaensis]|uniref:Uncharacterized protein n=1 Tax=Vibrio hyugaensis TaxID=1534743 RepID=A0ABQ5Y1A1_9VIBR|nr:hypothetical protein GCM10007906_14320 [Vibrio hyugaensis]